MMVNLDTLYLKYPLHITGVVHVGAHSGEEAPAYAAHDVTPVWWIEGNPDLIPALQQNVGRFPANHVVEALVYDQDDVDLGFNITNVDAISSSILEFGTHAEKAPYCVFVERKQLRTKTLDTLALEHGIVDCNFLNMDLQGAEMFALRGGEKLLAGVDYVFTEINVDELYKDCVRVWELDEWLGTRGFLRVETCMAENHVGWGDALYIKKPC